MCEKAEIQIFENDEFGIDYNVMRSYYYGNRFPKAERYNLIVAGLERLNKFNEKE